MSSSESDQNSDTNQVVDLIDLSDGDDKSQREVSALLGMRTQHGSGGVHAASGLSRNISEICKTDFLGSVFDGPGGDNYEMLIPATSAAVRPKLSTNAYTYGGWVNKNSTFQNSTPLLSNRDLSETSDAVDSDTAILETCNYVGRVLHDLFTADEKKIGRRQAQAIVELKSSLRSMLCTENNLSEPSRYGDKAKTVGFSVGEGASAVDLSLLRRSSSNSCDLVNRGVMSQLEATERKPLSTSQAAANLGFGTEDGENIAIHPQNGRKTPLRPLEGSEDNLIYSSRKLQGRGRTSDADAAGEATSSKSDHLRRSSSGQHTRLEPNMLSAGPAGYSTGIDSRQLLEALSRLDNRQAPRPDPFDGATG